MYQEEPDDDEPHRPIIIGLDVGAHISTFQPVPPRPPKPSRRVPLPKPGGRNVLITSALARVDKVPNLDDVVGSVLSADVFARYSRACGDTTLFVGGTNDYSTTIHAKAMNEEEEECTPQQLSGKCHKMHAEMYSWFEIDFDVFGRTSNKKHAGIAQDVVVKLQRNGLVEERMVTTVTMTTPPQLMEDLQCPDDDGSTPMPVAASEEEQEAESRRAFLRLDKLQPEIEAFVCEAADTGKWSFQARRAAAMYLAEEENLAARRITRDDEDTTWGTPVSVPLEDEKAMSLLCPWFDLCLGHASMTAAATDAWEKWWRNPAADDDVRLYQFMGTHDVGAHCLLPAATLLGTRDGWTRPHHLAATAHLAFEGSGSGRCVSGDAARATGVDADVWRWCLLWHRPEGDSDSSSDETGFGWDSVVEASNTLTVCLERVVLRVVDCVNHVCYGGVVPDWQTPCPNDNGKGPPPHFWLGVFNKLLARYRGYMDNLRIRDAMEVALRMADQLDLVLLDADAALHGDGANVTEETTEDDFAADVGFAVNAAHLVASAVAPFMPETARRICHMLNADATPHLPREFWMPSILGEHGHEIGKPRELFSPVHPGRADEWRRKFGVGEKDDGPVE